MAAAPFPWYPPLLERFQRHLEAGPRRDGAHDLSHALRVARAAVEFAAAEGADGEACLAAALLHDLVYLPKNHPDSSRTAALSAEMAQDWCAGIPALAPRAGAIAQAIATHSFSGGLPPASVEGAILQDADRLEAIGAIGIARCFATGGSMGIRLWDSGDPWARARPLDDKVFSLDHFAQKLLKLAPRMNTVAGRHLAERRHRTLEGFLEALREELG